MTDAKAKHLGRACALACKLASKVEVLYRLRSELHQELQYLAGREVATAFTDDIMTRAWPTHALGELFSQLVERVEGGAK